MCYKMFMCVWIYLLVYGLLSAEERGVINKDIDEVPSERIPLERLRNVFDDTDCSQPQTLCQTLTPYQVSSYLRYNVSASTKHLCLSIINERYGTVDLRPLVNLTSLLRLQITTPQKLMRNGVVLIFPDEIIMPLPLEELHITIPIYATDDINAYTSFLQSLPNVSVVSFRYTLRLNRLSHLSSIIRSLEGKPLVALSLKAFQSFNQYHHTFMLELNTTQLFWPLRKSPLQHLDLSENDLLDIRPGISQVMPNLRIITLSYNNLVNSMIKPLSNEIMLHPVLQIIECSNQDSNDKKYSSNFGKEVDTKYVSSSNEGTEKPIFSRLYDRCPEQLGFNVSDLLEKQKFCKLEKCLLPELFNLPCEALPSWTDIFPLDFSCSFYIKFPIGKHLTEINIANINAFGNEKKIPNEKQVVCFGDNSVKKIDFSKNAQLLAGFYIDEVMKLLQLSGLDHVTHVDLAQNELNVPLQNTFISSFRQLEYLYLGGNFIDTNDTNICQANKLLKVLDLSKNKLKKTPDLLDCQNLQTLDVSGNDLEDLFIKPRGIKVLNASNNKIAWLSTQSISSLKTLGQISNLTVDLSYNPWDCGCSMKSIESLHFLQTASQYGLKLPGLEQYQCYGRSGYSLVNNVKIDQLTVQCYPNHTRLYIKTILITTGIIIFVTSFIVCFKCRYRINTFYFHTCRQLNDRMDPSSSRLPIKYDAFVSYAAEDRFWVHDVLMTQLEGKYGLKLCLHYRDFPAHGDLADVICEKMGESRSLVVVLSRHSVVRPWCQYELKIAHAQHLRFRQQLTIIKLGHIPGNLELSDLVHDLLNSYVYIEWPEVGLQDPSASDRRRLDVFWLKLQKAIYGRDFCECFRYCSPFYRRNESLRVPLMDDMEDEL